MMTEREIIQTGFRIVRDLADRFPALVPLTEGFFLGWSVAWPPGPINAEMLRRGLTRGFWPALSVGIGACAGDFLWALLVALGAGALLAGVPAFRPVFGAVSVALLLFLAWTFAKGARRDWQRRGHPARTEPAGRFDSGRGGLLLGLAAALTSPWNLAFWLAVMGSQAGGERLGVGASVALAVGVVTGAMTWSVLVCGTLRLKAARRFASPGWQTFTQSATAALLLGIALQKAWELRPRR